MKTLYTLLLSTILYSASAQSFDYFESNPSWVESYINSNDNLVPLLYYIGGDSTVRGVEYHKLMLSGYSFRDTARSTSRVHGLIRQDGYKILYRGFLSPYNLDYPDHFYIQPTDTFPDEFVLYNFGLSMGDTIYAKDYPLLNSGNPDDYYVVYGLDSTSYKPLPSTFARRFSLKGNNVGSSCFIDYFEGIGDANNFLGSTCSDERSFLQCFQNDSTGFIEPQYQYIPSYLDEGTPQLCSVFVTSIEEQKSESIGVYPNPSTGVVHFSGAMPQLVQVYNAQGQQVIVINKPSGISNISLVDQPQGLYFVRYQIDGVTHFSKLVLE